MGSRIEIIGYIISHDSKQTVNGGTHRPAYVVDAHWVPPSLSLPGYTHPRLPPTETRACTRSKHTVGFTSPPHAHWMLKRLSDRGAQYSLRCLSVLTLVASIRVFIIYPQILLPPWLHRMEWSNACCSSEGDLKVTRTSSPSRASIYRTAQVGKCMSYCLEIPLEQAFHKRDCSRVQMNHSVIVDYPDPA